MTWKCPPLHLFNWNNLWKWKQEMINEHDIADHECRLHELHKGEKFKVDNKEFTFEYTDGDFRVCIDSEGTFFHFGAFSKVVKL